MFLSTYHCFSDSLKSSVLGLAKVNKNNTITIIITTTILIVNLNQLELDNLS